LPRCVTQANAINNANTMPVPTPAASPTHAEPVTADTAAAANAAPSIFPSRPRSTTPARSENMPARAASKSGAATRIVAAKTRTISV
jgi:hypothetical protein